jgi:hypothetical protein
MSKPSRKNTKTFYVEDYVDAIITDVAERNHRGNRSSYIKHLVIRDLQERLIGKREVVGDPLLS